VALFVVFERVVFWWEECFWNRLWALFLEQERLNIIVLVAIEGMCFSFWRYRGEERIY